jgi:hypothetical protein
VRFKKQTFIKPILNDTANASTLRRGGNDFAPRRNRVAAGGQVGQIRNKAGLMWEINILHCGAESGIVESIRPRAEY